MLYEEFEPRAETRSFLHRLWTLETDDVAVQRIVPDGRPEVIVNLGRPFEWFRGNQWRLQPRVFLVGQITGPLLVRPSGPARILGARFQPQGAARLVTIAMDSIVDDLMPVEITAE